ncbi:MAG TPA: hypothetical protein VMB83_15250 [Roseiarcus sp.]|nr:hypothetical protein [Roseiarcus sp.]
MSLELSHGALLDDDPRGASCLDLSKAGDEACQEPLFGRSLRAALGRTLAAILR